MDSSSLQVGELARITGKTVRALRLYQQMGLLRPDSRSGGGFHLFDLGAVERVRWIEKLQDLGFTLSGIAGLLRDLDEAPNAPAGLRDVRHVLAGRLVGLRDQIGRLQRLEAELERSVAYLECCDACTPPQPLSSCPECSRPRPDPRRPSLVSALVTGRHHTA
ncbi:MAG: MerR family transcriptional regulator [Candidatus Krumholzibacteriia bacterium]